MSLNPASMALKLSRFLNYQFSANVDCFLYCPENTVTMATLYSCTAPPSSSFIHKDLRRFRQNPPPATVLRHRSAMGSENKKAENGAASAPAPVEGAVPVRIVALVGEGSVSPLMSTPWYDVMLHTAKKLKWVDDEYEMLVFSDNFYEADDKTTVQLRESLEQANILMIVAVTNQESVRWIQANCQDVSNVICFDSSPALANKLGGSLIPTKTTGSIFSKLPLPQPKQVKESEEVVRSVFEAWDRQNSDDIRFCLLVVINAYIRPVPILKNLRAKGFSTLNCMVCNYRCIASYESRQLEEFSLCVLQKHNCLELDAKIPEKPLVTPMVEFRGRDLDYEMAEDLFVGWLGSLDWSWRVVAGQNPAYDQFPCQYQLFYRGKAKGSFWYEPVFQVRTLDGDLVWRRRKYRVKRGKIPGTFHFSVLDNGVVSNEFWTIVDVSDDFSWGLFHYHGAARAAGQSYTGAVLVSADGLYPDESQNQRLAAALDRCSIKEWELFVVDNCSCQNPPLGLPEGSSLHRKIKVEDSEGSSVNV
ncbi:hypothetical protein Salat_2559100 [Sesamum alatum]|uniref:VDE lipocalin domain-containing protein n=1 Tax=Sesamum alatum TaxID=300844 RepID=A0AAE2CCT3_9LAMI|nr:hypothetical protein Salat_2559100 [Sesamum alatum]